MITCTTCVQHTCAFVMRVSWGEGGCRGITVSSYVCERRAVLLHCVREYGIRMEVKIVLHRVCGMS